MKFPKFLRKIYYKYFAKINSYTVVLRGALSKEQESFVNSHKSFSRVSKRAFMLNKVENRILEIGFGNGSFLKYLGENYKESDFTLFGLELDKISIWKFLKVVDREKFQNFKIVCADARSFLHRAPKRYFEQIFVLYSDPWPKKRDFKRRLINNSFIDICLEKIKKNGCLVFATDIQSYQEQIESILENLKKEYKIAYEILDKNNFTNSKFQKKIDLEEIFKTKFALRATKEGRENKIYIINSIL